MSKSLNGIIFLRVYDAVSQSREYSGSLRCFTYVQILHGSFSHVSGVCSTFFLDVVLEGGKVFVYIVFSTGYHVFLL
jgi:hypothetical protein